MRRRTLRFCSLSKPAFTSLRESKGEYPPSVNKNEKRSIRRKAGKLCVIQGEIFYLHKDGQKVCAAIDIGLYHFQELHSLICMVQYCIYLIGGGRHF